MRNDTVRRIALAVTIVLSAAHETRAADAASSDTAPEATRDALEARAKRFLDALQTNTADALLSARARVTENGSVIALSKSLLAGTRGYPYQAFFAEPAAATLGVFGVADVGESPLVFSARLRVGADAIEEVELITARPGEASVAAPAQLTVVHPMYETLVAPAQRTSRAGLIAAADAYFDGIEAGSSADVPFAEGCNRVENGFQTTNNPSSGSALLALSCSAGLPYLTYIQDIRDRRYPVVDEARGLVWGLAVFDIPGGPNRQVFPDGQVVERTQPPRSILISELFKVVDGRIERIEVVMRNAPLGAASGWPAEP